MKNLFIVTLFLLLQSFPSFGSVDGKGIVCKCLECKLDHLDPSSLILNDKPSEIGFHFKINKVAIYYISKIGDKIKVSENIQTTLRKKKRFYSIDNVPELNLGSKLESSGKIFSYTIKILRKMGLDKGYFKERALLFESNLMMIGVKSDEENYSIYKK